MRLLLVGLIVPHAPVLVPGIRGTAGEQQDLELRKDDDTPLCVVLSPHGVEAGVYRRVRGSLGGFGVPGIDVARRTDRVFGKHLARTWQQPLLESDIDHGVLVPLIAALPAGLPVVAATLREITGPGAAPVEQAVDAARDLAIAVKAIAGERDLIVAASAHTSAALSPTAPLTDRPAGHELEKQVTFALEEDLGLLSAIDIDLWAEAGACGAGPLTAFGLLFAGQTARVTFREAPFGVGYLLAQTS